jgi:drug/metabolite transporter (DMT)-like permease
MESMIKKVGSWLFLIGICVALLVGLIFGVGQAMKTDMTNLEIPLGIVVAVLGFIVGILSFFALGAVTQEKVPTFLIASLILIGLAIAVSSTTWIFGSFRELAPLFTNITQYLAIFVAPAAVILVVRSLWDAARPKETAK